MKCVDEVLNCVAQTVFRKISFLQYVDNAAYSGDLSIKENISNFSKHITLCIGISFLLYVAPLSVWLKNFHGPSTFVWWALYILFKFVKSLTRYLDLAIGNVRHVRWFSWTLPYIIAIYMNVQCDFCLCFMHSQHMCHIWCPNITHYQNQCWHRWWNTHTRLW